jgi:hypothetical protein
MTANQAAATTIYYTPYLGNQFPVYDGTSAFSPLTFAELTNSTTQSSTGNAGPAAVAANKTYDLFGWSNAGVATLTRGAAWNSDTIRSATTENDLTRVNGVPVNLNAITNGPAAMRGTFLGTVRSDGSSQINWIVGGIAASGTAALLNVWNMYNRIDVSGLVGDSTASWTYASGTIRSANNSATNRASWIAGLAEDFFVPEHYALGSGLSSTSANIGIGIDSTTTFSGSVGRLVQDGTDAKQAIGKTEQRLLGFHFAQAVERRRRQQHDFCRRERRRAVSRPPLPGALLMATFTDALIYLRPGAEFSNKDDTLGNVRWDTPGIVPPTQREIDAALVALAPADPEAMTAYHALQLRRADQLAASSDIADQVAALKIRLELLGG